jgi:DNA-binding MurR/RpiR family transcriptional regulator
MTRQEARQKVAEYITANPHFSYRQIAEKLQCSLSTVSTIAREFGVSRQRAALSEADLSKLEG